MKHKLFSIKIIQNLLLRLIPKPNSQEQKETVTATTNKSPYEQIQDDDMHGRIKKEKGWIRPADATNTPYASHTMTQGKFTRPFGCSYLNPYFLSLRFEIMCCCGKIFLIMVEIWIVAWIIFLFDFCWI